MNSKSHVIYKFTPDSDISEWNIINDKVMGGKSTSSITLNSNGNGEFKGSISLENNGGFSSLRLHPRKISTSGSHTFFITLKGDGKPYQFRIRHRSEDKFSYIAPFETSGDWEVITIHLNDMYASYRGERLNIPNFSKDSFEELTFLIGNNKAEDFKLLIDSIELK